MDHERLLVSKIIESNDLSEVMESGIQPIFFRDIENRRVYQRIRDYRERHGSVPTLRTIKSDFPTYRFVEVEEPFTDLIGRLRKQHNLSVLYDAITDSISLYDGEDTEAILGKFSEAIKSLAADNQIMQDEDVTKTVVNRLERYALLKDQDHRLLGIPSGFDTIDNATLGFQPKQLVTFVGPPKAGKSTTMLLVARNAHQQNYSPMVIGFEMTNDEQTTRLDAISAKVSHHKLRSGALDEDEMSRLKRELHSMEGMRQFIFSNDTMSTTTLSGIEAKLDKYRPDILIVDGVYMMQDEDGGERPGSPQALTNITRGFKRMAQNWSIPVIITTQVLEWKMDKKRGITSNSIGYSSSFGQDSDVVIGTENTDDPRTKKIKIVISRNCGPQEVYVEWDWDSGEFREKEVVEDEEGEERDF